MSETRLHHFFSLNKKNHTAKEDVRKIPEMYHTVVARNAICNYFFSDIPRQAYKEHSALFCMVVCIFTQMI